MRRVVLANLLFEKNFYSDGEEIAERIETLVKQCDPDEVGRLAIEARLEQKLRHVPLLLARELARNHALKAEVLSTVIQRADELAEFLALYWKDGKVPLAKQVKLGLAKAFTKFNAYQLAKHNGRGKVSLKDVLYLCHATPLDVEQDHLWKRLIGGFCENCWGVKPTNSPRKSRFTKPCQCGNFKEAFLPTPDTWEVALSTGKDKKETWERLISERKIGALAFVRNLRNMVKVGVSHNIIEYGFKTINPQWLLPINFIAAARSVPRYESHLEKLMLKGLEKSPKLPGRTIVIVDVSGSMNAHLSKKSNFTRLDVSSVLAILAREMCEDVVFYVTAGIDALKQHKTALIAPRRGFALAEQIRSEMEKMGKGGIFTRQALEYVRQQEQGIPERIIVISDSQDMDHANLRVPKPFGKFNYIIDVGSEKYGINYEGVWTAEISGWSERFLDYIAALEGFSLQDTEE